MNGQGGSKSPTIDVLDDVSDISDGDIPDVEVIEEKNKIDVPDWYSFSHNFKSIKYNQFFKMILHLLF